MSRQQHFSVLIATLRTLHGETKEWKKLQSRAENLVDRIGYWTVGILAIIIIGIIIWKG